MIRARVLESYGQSQKTPFSRPKLQSQSSSWVRANVGPLESEDTAHLGLTMAALSRRNTMSALCTNSADSCNPILLPQSPSPAPSAPPPPPPPPAPGPGGLLAPDPAPAPSPPPPAKDEPPTTTLLWSTSSPGGDGGAASPKVGTPAGDGLTEVADTPPSACAGDPVPAAAADTTKGRRILLLLGYGFERLSVICRVDYCSAPSIGKCRLWGTLPWERRPAGKFSVRFSRADGKLDPVLSPFKRPSNEKAVMLAYPSSTYIGLRGN